MNPEKHLHKPDVTPERIDVLSKDGTALRNALESRRRWLTEEKAVKTDAEKKVAIDKAVLEIDRAFGELGDDAHVSEDQALRFMHAAAKILGETKYGHDAQVINFEEEKTRRDR